jgi:hypothetical protein
MIPKTMSKRYCLLCLCNHNELSVMNGFTCSSKQHPHSLPSKDAAFDNSIPEEMTETWALFMKKAKKENT